MATIPKKITGELKVGKAKIAGIKEIKNIPDYKEKIQANSEASVTDFLEIILAGAVELNASDLHLEPQKEEMKMRIRIDGILQDVILLDLEKYQNLLSRIKLLSGIKLNISDRPQDGRFSIFFDQAYQKNEVLVVEIRVSTLPAEHGETIVLRLLNPQSLIELDVLGLRKDLLKMVEKEIGKPNGMILVTGPTGSGKTTTLYAFCQKIRKPEVKIITIEDPIEYHLEGLSQTQVDPGKGYDFASGLKSVMRQDPDVILVGEIRDAETVNTALQAALTGHLVLTTLHTNDAAGVVTRLVSLEGKLANIGPAINMAIAQRLVRQVCKKCSQQEKISNEELQMMKKGLASLRNNSGLKIPKLTSNLKIPKAKGCKACNETGYKERIGIFEILLVNEKIEKFILKEPSIAELRELAVKEGMITMKQDGLIKVLEGLTTIEELERVMGE